MTNGYLPLAAFRHLEPTAIGTVDLGSPPRFAYTPGLPATGVHRDSLALIRMHGEPLGVIHLEGEPSRLSSEQLAEAVWAQTRPAIIEHVARHGCASVLEGATSLLAGLPAADFACTDCTTVSPTGSVAVIISTTGRVDVLERCLRSLAQIDRADVEVIVVDNRPETGETRALVSTMALSDPRIRYVPEPRKGLSVARNRGLAEASAAEFVAFTDDDAVVDPGWLFWLLAPFADTSVTATTGMVLPLGLETAAQKRFEQYAGFSKGTDRRCYDLTTARADDRLLYPYWGGMFGSGNSMAFRRHDLLMAGGFDPTLGAGSPTGGGEDIAAFSDAILRGGRLVYEPRSLCWHEHRRDEDALRKQLFNYGAGFAASLCRAALHDRRFLWSAANAIPTIVKLLYSRARTGSEETEGQLPTELQRLEYSGMRRGPVLYAKSVRRASLMGLGDHLGLQRRDSLAPSNAS
ncbi:MAG: glycosyltransferase [Solirubrobacterales bacterium]|nr:glycosyltransferase [Solirubrobacterales bacterium]